MAFDFRSDFLIGRLVIPLKLFRQRVFDLPQGEKDLPGAVVERMILEELVEVLPCDPVILRLDRIQPHLELRIDDPGLAIRPLCTVRETCDVFAPLLDRRLIFLLLETKLADHENRLAGPIPEGLVAGYTCPDFRIHRRFLRHKREIPLPRKGLVGRDRVVGLAGVSVSQCDQAGGIRRPWMARMLLDETTGLLDATIQLVGSRMGKIVCPHQQPMHIRPQRIILLVSELE